MAIPNYYEAAIATFLLSRTEITSVVGENVFPNEAFQGASYPTITYEVFNEEELSNLAGDDDKVWIYFRFTIWAENNSTRRVLQDALRNVLSGKHNTLLTYTEGSVILRSSVMVSGGRDMYQGNADGTETGIFERSVSFRMCFNQTLPTL